MGSCSDVIAATKTLRSMPATHHLDPVGLIDRDFRDNATVNALREKGVEVLEVHEVEQLLLMEPVIAAVAKSLARDDASSIVEAIQSLVFNKVNTNFNLAAARLAANRIRLQLPSFDIGVRDEAALKSEFDDLTAKVDPAKVFPEVSEELRRAIDQKDYRAVLKLYSDKGLVKEVADNFGFTGVNYVEHVKRLIARKDDHGIVAAIQNELPSFK